MLFKTIGSMLIVTGTAVGAGMLAIPLVTNQMGFWPACFWIIACYLVMLSTALLILEVNLAFPKAVSFSTMAVKTLGKRGQYVTWLSFCLLLYALAAAYITGGGSLLQSVLNTAFSWHLNSEWSAFIFMLVLSAFVFCGTRAVDYANRLLMLCKLGAFLILVIFLAPHVRIHLLHHAHLKSSWFAIPILVTSFGFHVVIPSIRQYIGDDVKRLRLILVVGCTLPLVIYLLWVTVTLGVLPMQGTHSFHVIDQAQGSVGDLVENLQGYLQLTSVKIFANCFTDVAITTSFLGVCMGLYDFMVDGCKLPKTHLKNRLLLWVITFVPPLVFALFYPHGFILALGYASIFVAILLIILPPLMSWRLRDLPELHSQYQPLLAKPLLILLVLIGLVVVGLQVFA